MPTVDKALMMNGGVLVLQGPLGRIPEAFLQELSFVGTIALSTDCFFLVEGFTEGSIRPSRHPAEKDRVVRPPGRKDSSEVGIRWSEK